MANGAQHRTLAGLGVGGVILAAELRRNKLTGAPFVGGVIGTLSGTLPDVLEPANHPNHRQFFHSWLTAAVIAKILWELHRWQPTDDLSRCLRFAALCACGGYLIHLGMDAMTPKGLPII